MGVLIQMSGGRGPDGMTIDAHDGLVVAHPDMGAVWIFSHRGEPLYRVQSCGSDLVTNVAFGGPDRKTIYITDSGSGCVTDRARADGRARALLPHVAHCTAFPAQCAAKGAKKMNLNAADIRADSNRSCGSRRRRDAVRIRHLHRLSGGAVQENWALDAEVTGGAWSGAQRWVLRTDAAARVEASLKRSEEFQVLQSAHAAGLERPGTAVDVRGQGGYRAGLLHHAATARRCKRASPYPRGGSYSRSRTPCARARR